MMLASSLELKRDVMKLLKRSRNQIQDMVITVTGKKGRTGLDPIRNRETEHVFKELHRFLGLRRHDGDMTKLVGHDPPRSESGRRQAHLRIELQQMAAWLDDLHQF